MYYQWLRLLSKASHQVFCLSHRKATEKGLIMKLMPLILVTSLFFLLISCQESKKKSSSINCTDSNYFAPGCPGYNPYSTGGATTGNNAICSQGNNYANYVGCPGFCQAYPQHTSCLNGGGTTGGMTNPYPQYPSQSVTPNWGVKYPGGVPAGSCLAAASPASITYTPYETRKATMTIVGKTWYSPADPAAPNYLNTSSLLRSVMGARQLFETDSVLKVRFKALPQPESSNASPYCYDRKSGASIAGYTKLQFSVTLVGLTASGVTQTEALGTFTIGVNSCTSAIDLSSYASTFPGGIYLRVEAVKGNQHNFPNNYEQFGFRDMNGFSDIRSMDCWSLDVEVAADGTKTF
jgi:hypothetical protein